MCSFLCVIYDDAIRACAVSTVTADRTGKTLINDSIWSPVYKCMCVLDRVYSVFLCSPVKASSLFSRWQDEIAHCVLSIVHQAQPWLSPGPSGPSCHQNPDYTRSASSLTFFFQTPGPWWCCKAFNKHLTTLNKYSHKLKQKLFSVDLSSFISYVFKK